MNLCIRFCQDRREDWETFFSLYSHYLMKEAGLFLSEEGLWETCESMWLERQRGREEIQFLFSGQESVGLVIYQHQKAYQSKRFETFLKNAGYIQDFYIIPPSRHKGYGSFFYRQIESILQNQGASGIFLHADPSTGENFWNKFGFRPIQKAKLDPNAWLYLKTF